MNDYKHCLDQERDLYIEIRAEKTGKNEAIRIISNEDSIANGEARLQLLEGTTYEYRLSEGLRFEGFPGFIRESKFNISTGRIQTGISVGTVSLKIVDKKKRDYNLDLEIRSKKLSYRNDYRFMLETIAEKCTDLLMTSNAMASGNFTPDYSTDPKTAYQRFAFVKSFFDSEEFEDAIYRVLQDPVTDWVEEIDKTDIRRIGKLTGRHLRQISNATNRQPLPDHHNLKKKISSLPAEIEDSMKEDTTDVHENRFVRFALQEVQDFCSQIKEALKQSDSEREYLEAVQLEEKIEGILKHDLFRELSNASYIPLNSPVLQRREGYREILNFWLQYELAAQLIWRGGDDVYKAGKRDVAVLYEYWLFFLLMEVIASLFEIEPKTIDNLFESTENGLNLKLKAGRHVLLKGVFRNPVRNLCVEYNYNREFSASKDHKHPGSWSAKMRPDFTLSLWPEAFSRDEAEKQELMVHIHFDAKYKVQEISEIIGETRKDFNQEKEDEKKGIYKRGDLLKMHAYKDAIKRTGGAYVLYPGTSEKIFRGFHEIIPGLGAFAIRPASKNNGVDELKTFLTQVMNHVINRASKREYVSYYRFNTYKHKGSYEVRERIPEYYSVHNRVRTPPPESVNVLVGYYKDDAHLKWIMENGYYNVRREGRGKLTITDEVLRARYLLLHTKGQLISDLIFFKDSQQPEIKTKKEMAQMQYPNPGHKSYYLFKIDTIKRPGFDKAKWDIRKLNNYKPGRQSGYPFTATLAEITNAKVT